MEQDPPLVPYGEDFYKLHPRSCDPHDYWSQVRRTVGGKPVSEDQIRLITVDVRDRLELDGERRLLDLCCGNGALTVTFTDDCEDIYGVDFSEALIEVAKRDFAREGLRFELADVLEWVDTAPNPERFDRVLCYGSYSYLPEERGLRMLERIARRFSAVSRLYLGNLPDLAHAAAFFEDREHRSGDERRHDTQIGCWYDPLAFAERVRPLGWRAEISRMPEGFFGGAMRFDAVLHRA